MEDYPLNLVAEKSSVCAVGILLVDTGDRCGDLMDGSMRNLRCGFVQCDEIWTYVGKKQKQVRDADSPEIGDQWVFVAMDAETKLIPVFTVGKRNEDTLPKRMSDQPDAKAEVHLRDVPLLHRMQDLEPVPLLRRHPQLLLSFRHALAKRNFLLCTKRNFSSCGDKLANNCW
jgi:hypothetical protein